MASIRSVARSVNSFLSNIAPPFLENNVPDNAAFPYLTYTLSSEEFGKEGMLQIRIFTKSTSTTQVGDLTDKLESLVRQGTVLKLDDGTIWLYKGSPFAQYITEENNVKSCYILLNYRLFQ